MIISRKSFSTKNIKPTYRNSFLNSFLLNLKFPKTKCVSFSAILHMKIKTVKSILLGKIFLIENECKTPIGCLIFVSYQKYFLWWNGLKAYLFSCYKLLFPLPVIPLLEKWHSQWTLVKHFVKDHWDDNPIVSLWNNNSMWNIWKKFKLKSHYKRTLCKKLFEKKHEKDLSMFLLHPCL